MNIQVDPTSSNLASAMLTSKIRPRAVVGYGVKIFQPSPPNYVTRSPGKADSGYAGVACYTQTGLASLTDNRRFLVTERNLNLEL